MHLIIMQHLNPPRHIPQPPSHNLVRMPHEPAIFQHPANVPVHDIREIPVFGRIRHVAVPALVLFSVSAGHKGAAEMQVGRPCHGDFGGVRHVEIGGSGGGEARDYVLPGLGVGVGNGVEGVPQLFALFFEDLPHFGDDVLSAVVDDVVGCVQAFYKVQGGGPGDGDDGPDAEAGVLFDEFSEFQGAGADGTRAAVNH